MTTSKFNATVQFSSGLTAAEHSEFSADLGDGRLTRKQAERLAKKYGSQIWLSDEQGSRRFHVQHTGVSYPT